MSSLKQLETLVSPETVKRYIGAPLKRKRAYYLVQGRGQYADDVEPPEGTLYVSFVRSPIARGKILRIDASKALKLEGVVKVFTGEDFRNITMGYWMHMPTMKEPVRRLLALGRVTYHGEPVAAVVAKDQYVAEDAAELVEVEYEPEEPILDPLEALKNPEKRVFPELEDNIQYADSYYSTPDLHEIIDRCDVVVEETLRYARSAPVTLEPRVQLASYDGEYMRVWSSTQYPHVLRTYISETLDIPENRIRVFALDVGGGFGPKSAVFSDDMTVFAIAKELKATVKWVPTRTEDLLTTGHERDQIHRVRAGFTRQGKLVALYDEIIADVGAGTTFWGEVQPVMVASVSVPGPYKFQHYGFEVKAVMTNKAPWSPNIGFGRPVAAFVMERIMDIAAKRLGMDPAEIRRINLVRKDEFPYKSPAGVIYDSGNYEGGLEKLLETMRYGELVKLRDELRKKGKYLGIGLGVYSEYTAPSSQRLQLILGWEVGGYEKAVVKVTPNGKVVVSLGTKDMGQGHETIFAQIAADVLGVNVDDVYVFEGDTERDPYGFGSWASRSTVTAGNAIILAAQKVRKKVLRIAAHLLKEDESNLEISEGVIHSRVSSKKITLREVATVAYRKPILLPPGEEPEIEEQAVYEPPSQTTVVSYAWHGAVVEVDPEIGQVKLLKYFVVDDAGVIVNPLSAEAQVQGTTLAQGIQQTLQEMKYDANGILLTSNFWNHVIITAKEVPDEFEVVHIESPSPTPGGFKGLGEGGAIGAPAALSNAISDALSPFGIEVTKIPISWEEIWELVKQKGKK